MADSLKAPIDGKEIVVVSQECKGDNLMQEPDKRPLAIERVPIGEDSLQDDQVEYIPSFRMVAASRDLVLLWPPLMLLARCGCIQIRCIFPR